MRFKHDGQEFRIRFHHTRYAEPQEYVFDDRRRFIQAVTVCHIDVWDPQLIRTITAGTMGSGDWRSVAAAEAHCSVDDVYRKETARVLSLRRAVLAWATPAHLVFNGMKNYKEARRAAFGAYFDRHA